MRYHEFITEGYKEVVKKFTQSASLEEVLAATDAFRELVKKNQVTGDDKNIDVWGKRGWNEFKSFVDMKSQQKTQKQIKTAAVEGNSVTLKETDDWIFSLPLDKDSSCFIGKDTHWCTSHPQALDFERKFYKDKHHLIYIVNKNNPQAKWAIEVSETGAVLGGFDKVDNHITISQLSGETNIEQDVLRQVVKDSVSDKNKKIMDSYRKKYAKAFKQVEKALEQFDGSRDEALEQAIMDIAHPHFYKQYMSKVGVSEYPIPFQKKAVRAMTDLVEYIKNPSESVVNYVMSSDIGFYSELPKTPEVIRAFVKRVSPSDMVIIFPDETFSPEVQRELIKRDISFATALPELDPKVFDMVLKIDPFALSARRNKTPEEQQKLEAHFDNTTDDVEDFFNPT